MKEIKGSTVRRRYARLPLALALGAMVLTPAVIGVGASTAEASVAGKGETSISLSGDARLRGFMREDFAFGNVDDDENRQLQHRMRINVDVATAGGTSLHTRFHMSSDGDDTSMYQYGGDRNRNVATDYLYVNVPVGDATVVVGRQVINWAHKMKAWDARADRVRANYRVNDEVTVFAYYQKDLESQWAADQLDADLPPYARGVDFDGDEDRNRYSLGMIFNTPDLRVGAQIRHTDEEWSGGDDGQELYGFATFKAAPLTVNFEADFTFGDVHKLGDRTGSNPYAMFLGLSYALGDTTLTAGGAYAKNGWSSVAGGHFDQITMFYNTSGGHGLGHTNFGRNSDDREYALGVGASHKLSPELTIGGKLAYIDGKNGRADEFGGFGGAGSDWDVIAVDAGLAYKVNASTTYHVDAIYAEPSGFITDVADEAYWGLGHRFEIRF